MADSKDPRLSESPRPGGFYRIPALSGKPEDDRYVDSEGRDVPKEEVQPNISAMEDKSTKAEELANAAPAGAAVSPAYPLRAPTNQRPVVEAGTENAAGAPGVAGGGVTSSGVVERAPAGGNETL